MKLNKNETLEQKIKRICNNQYKFEEHTVDMDADKICEELELEIEKCKKLFYL